MVGPTRSTATTRRSTRNTRQASRVSENAYEIPVAKKSVVQNNSTLVNGDYGSTSTSPASPAASSGSDSIPFGVLGVPIPVSSPGTNGLNNTINTLNENLRKIGIENCPQCQKPFNISNCRPVQDCCGHFKCRSCFINNDEEKCLQCCDANKNNINNKTTNGRKELDILSLGPPKLSKEHVTYGKKKSDNNNMDAKSAILNNRKLPRRNERSVSTNNKIIVNSIFLPNSTSNNGKRENSQRANKAEITSRIHQITPRIHGKRKIDSMSSSASNESTVDRDEVKRLIQGTPLSFNSKSSSSSPPNKKLKDDKQQQPYLINVIPMSPNLILSSSIKKEEPSLVAEPSSPPTNNKSEKILSNNLEELETPQTPQSSSSSSTNNESSTDFALLNRNLINNDLSNKKKKKRSPFLIHEHITILNAGETSPPMYQCNVCTKKFKTKAHIKYHEFCQNGEKPFKCEECGQGFIAKSHYEYHLRTHTGERPYVCPKCGKGFNQRGKVTRHMRSHTGEKPFVCQQCGRGFANAQALRSHTLIHTGERPFACQYCNKRFTGMTNLKKHVITHTGERPFLCKTCGKSFGLKWTLDLHLRTHSSERPYACDKCSRAFSNSKDLRRHLVIHSGERPFSCWICGTAFRRKDNLDRHIKNTHNQPKEVAKQLANEAAADYIARTRNKQNLLVHPLQEGSNLIRPFPPELTRSTEINIVIERSASSSNSTLKSNKIKKSPNKKKHKKNSLNKVIKQTQEQNKKEEEEKKVEFTAVLSPKSSPQNDEYIIPNDIWEANNPSNEHENDLGELSEVEEKPDIKNCSSPIHPECQMKPQLENPSPVHNLECTEAQKLSPEVIPPKRLKLSTAPELELEKSLITEDVESNTKILVERFENDDSVQAIIDKGHPKLIESENEIVKSLITEEMDNTKMLVESFENDDSVQAIDTDTDQKLSLEVIPPKRLKLSATPELELEKNSTAEEVENNTKILVESFKNDYSEGSPEMIENDTEIEKCQVSEDNTMENNTKIPIEIFEKNEKIDEDLPKLIENDNEMKKVSFAEDMEIKTNKPLESFEKIDEDYPKLIENDSEMEKVSFAEDMEIKTKKSLESYKNDCDYGEGSPKMIENDNEIEKCPVSEDMVIFEKIDEDYPKLIENDSEIEKCPVSEDMESFEKIVEDYPKLIENDREMEKVSFAEDMEIKTKKPLESFVKIDEDYPKLIENDSKMEKVSFAEDMESKTILPFESFENDNCVKAIDIDHKFFENNFEIEKSPIAEDMENTKNMAIESFEDESSPERIVYGNEIEKSPIAEDMENTANIESFENTANIESFEEEGSPERIVNGNEIENCSIDKDMENTKNMAIESFEDEGSPERILNGNEIKNCSIDEDMENTANMAIESFEDEGSPERIVNGNEIENCSIDEDMETNIKIPIESFEKIDKDDDSENDCDYGEGSPEMIEVKMVEKSTMTDLVDYEEISNEGNDQINSADDERQPQPLMNGFFANGALTNELETTNKNNSDQMEIDTPSEPSFEYPPPQQHIYEYTPTLQSHFQHDQSQIKFVYASQQPQDMSNHSQIPFGHNLLDENTKIIYAAAAAKAEPSTSENGQPGTYTLLYAEALGLREDPDDQLQYVYTSTTPNQQIMSSAQPFSQIQMNHPEIYPLSRVDPRFLASMRQPQLPQENKQVPINITYDGRTASAQSIINRPECFGKMNFFSNYLKYYQQADNNNSIQYPDTSSMRMIEEPSPSTSNSSYMLNSNPSNGSSLAFIPNSGREPDKSSSSYNSLDTLANVATATLQRNGKVIQYEDDRDASERATRAAAAIAAVGQAARVKREQELQKKNYVQYYDVKYNRGPRKEYLSSQPSNKNI